MIKNFLTQIQKFRVALLYRRYLAMAQQRANTLHCKVYVVKVNGRPRMVTRNDLKYLRASRQVPKSFTSLDLQRIALFYVTPNR